MCALKPLTPSKRNFLRVNAQMCNLTWQKTTSSCKPLVVSLRTDFSVDKKHFVMTTYRRLINVGLFLAQVVPTIYLIYYMIANSGSPDIEIIINFVFIFALTITLFKNKNVFTLLVGLTLVIGNFTGLTAFETLSKYDFFLNIGSFPIPLYWGQPFYSILLLIYLIFNKGFYIGIATKEYWADFLTRTMDLEVAYAIINADTKNNEDKNSSEHMSER